MTSRRDIFQESSSICLMAEADLCLGSGLPLNSPPPAQRSSRNKGDSRMKEIYYLRRESTATRPVSAPKTLISLIPYGTTPEGEFLKALRSGSGGNELNSIVQSNGSPYLQPFRRLSYEFREYWLLSAPLLRYVTFIEIPIRARWKFI